MKSSDTLLTGRLLLAFSEQANLVNGAAIMRSKMGMNADYDIRVTSQLCLRVFSSFAYSSFPRKAYTNSCKTILTISDIAYVGLKTFHG